MFGAFFLAPAVCFCGTRMIPTIKTHMALLEAVYAAGVGLIAVTRMSLPSGFSAKSGIAPVSTLAMCLP